MCVRKREGVCVCVCEGRVRVTLVILKMALGLPLVMKPSSCQDTPPPSAGQPR